MYQGEEPPSRRDGRPSGGDSGRRWLPRPRRSHDARRSALGARRSALGARRSALGARRSALGARRSALGARHCTASRSVPQCQPVSLSPPTTIHFALLLTGIGLPPCCGVHGRPAAIPTDEPTPLKPFRQWPGCGTAARPLSFDTYIRPWRYLYMAYAGLRGRFRCRIAYSSPPLNTMVFAEQKTERCRNRMRRLLPRGQGGRCRSPVIVMAPCPEVFPRALPAPA